MKQCLIAVFPIVLGCSTNSQNEELLASNFRHQADRVLSSELIVVGNNFTVPATQEINFVPLKKSISPEFIKNHVPKILDLRNIQSSVKSQGQRGACTYFVISSFCLKNMLI